MSVTSGSAPAGASHSVPQGRQTTPPAVSVPAEHKASSLPGPIQRVTFTDLQINLAIQASVGTSVVEIGLTIDKKKGLLRSHVHSPAVQHPNFQTDLEIHLSEILMSLALASLNGVRESSVLTNFSSGV